MTDTILQWMGTTALMTMYVIMSFYPELYPMNLVAGITGGGLYLTWSYRQRNTAQILVNAAGILVCALGLIRVYFG